MQMSSGFTGRNSNRANTAFTIGVLTILGALCFEYIGGYVPCELCLGQRIPYYVGLPILGALIGAWKIVPAPARIVTTLLVAALFVWSTWLGTYHAGVEWGFWPGPTACTGTGEGTTFDSLSNINATRVIPCDKVQLRIFGISLAGYNAVISLVIAGLPAWSALGQVVRWRKQAK